MSDASDIRNAVEAAFGPGAFDLIDDESVAALSGHDSFGVETETTELEALREDTHPSVDAMFSPDETTQSTAELRQQMVFELSNTCFAIPIENIVEVQQIPDVTWMPRVPDWLRGIASLRGNVISVCDLCMFLGLSSVPSESARLMIVVKSAREPMQTALVAERVGGIRNIAPDSKTPSPDNNATNFVIARIECDGQPVCLVDLEGILLSGQMQQLQSQ